MAATNDLAERNGPDLSFLERAPARASEIPNLSVDRHIGEGPRRVGDRTLTVGRDIVLSGDIKQCDVLIVDGRLEASVPDAKHLNISSTGTFNGKAVVNDATIGGVFEGELTVTNRLRVTGTGRITGTIRYGHLEIENGGELSGNVAVSS